MVPATAYLFEIRVTQPWTSACQILTKLEATLPELEMQTFLSKDGLRILKTTDGNSRKAITQLKELDEKPVEFLQLSSHPDPKVM